MSKLSIKNKELMTSGVVGVVLILSGAILLFLEENLFAVIVDCVLLLAMLFAVWIQRKDSEPFDEMTKENSDEAANKTAYLLHILLVVLAIYLLISRQTITLNGGSIMMFIGSIQLIKMAFFLYIDGKASVEGE